MEASTKVGINLQITTFLTLSGRKCLYTLPDNAYGEWIIYEEDIPRYYFNIFYNEYNSVQDKLKQYLNLENHLEKLLQKISPKLQVKRKIVGISITKSKIKKIYLEKLPVSFLN